MIVFLDIPLPLPAIDLLPVGILFSIFYSIVAGRGRVNAVFAGALAFLGCMAAGGGLFYLLRDYLPREVRNGIDSFGIQSDIYLPYPMEGTVHLRGSMLLLVSCYIGMRIWMRVVAGKPVATEINAGELPERMRKKEPVGGVAVPEVRRSVLEAGIAADILQREGRKITMQVPEPVLAGRQEPDHTIAGKKPEATPKQVLAGAPERVRVLRPETGAGRGRMYPCVVDGEMLRPVGRNKPAATK